MESKFNKLLGGRTTVFTGNLDKNKGYYMLLPKVESVKSITVFFPKEVRTQDFSPEKLDLNVELPSKKSFTSTLRHYKDHSFLHVKLPVGIKKLEFRFLVQTGKEDGSRIESCLIINVAQTPVSPKIKPA